MPSVEYRLVNFLGVIICDGPEPYVRDVFSERKRDTPNLASGDKVVRVTTLTDDVTDA